ncbi:LLM class flavin-dependent oxidoreductase [Cryobacterium sp. Sr3]|nr:LLM class flavin-dependent oxidoreductase [Cryobacterium sp. Sr3]
MGSAELDRHDPSNGEPTVKVSILFAAQADGVADLKLYGRLAEQQSCRLWIGQSLLVESHQLFAALAGSGMSIDVGISVAIAPLRTPYDAAVQARSLAKLMRRSVSVAYGIGTPAFAETLNAAAGSTPGSFTREYVRDVKSLVNGAGINSEGPNPVRLYPMDAPSVEIGCGLLRPRMAVKAGAVADFVVTWLTPKSYLHNVLMPELQRGADSENRERPRVVAILQCAIAADTRNPVQLSYVGYSGHLQQPHYRDMLAKAGAVLTGEIANDVRATLKTGIFAYGSASEIADEIRTYADIGVDEVVLNMVGVAAVEGHQAAIDDMKQVMDCLESRTTTGAKNE